MWDKTEVKKLVASAGSPKRDYWSEIAAISRDDTNTASATQMGKKVATAKDQLSKKIVVLRLYNNLLAATINEKMIIKLKES